MSEHYDVVLVGAGLSGIGAACHLRRECPEKRVLILEGREALGGTWDLFRYPGIRSDSDMFTFGFAFEPWRDAKAIADGPSILAYLRATAEKHGVDRLIRYGHRVRQASWSSADARWTLDVLLADGTSARFTASFLWMCTGYYRYDHGYTPEFPGRERFRGKVIHPQLWPEDLDYSGQNVVVIGSGATAMTLVPAMAEKAGHVTMLQRSPTYVVTRPAKDSIAEKLQRHLPERLAYSVARWKNVSLGTLFYQLARRRPERMKAWLLREVRRALGPDVDVDAHFTPTYNPWDQRLCLVPDRDLFKALRSGKASVVTDTIETFTEGGIRLRSGVELPADLIVTATGLELLFLGGATLMVDGEIIDPPGLYSYKGMMFSGVPNLAFTAGYTNASWTLKADLVAEHVCRLLKRMDRRGDRVVTPRVEDDVEPAPFLDLASGYIQRAVDRFPRQGSRHPWRLHQNYFLDLLSLRYGKVEDPVLEFSRGPASGAKAEDGAGARGRARAS
ncbi:MAG: NAD(P)/FAD-dependent oxidoreductase [Nannocystaceae bacterium]